MLIIILIISSVFSITQQSFITNFASAQKVNPVVTWNEQTTELSYKHSLPIGKLVRAHALVHVAMYDALLEGEHYGNISKSAVIAGAASEVLFYLFPDDLDHISTYEIQTSANQSDNNEQVNASLKLGHLVGKEIVKYAINDGSNANFTGQIPTGNCTWHGTDPFEPMAGSWKTFILSSGAEIQPPPPYSCNSKEDVNELNKVLAVSLNRTQEEIKIVHKWDDSPVMTTWDDMLNDRIEKNGLDIHEATRAHAYLNVAMYDAFVSAWHAKYTYWTARPFMRISDLNTVVLTPNFPSYISGHATISAAASQVMAEIFPAERDYFIAQAQEAAYSRLLGGIHFDQDNARGLDVGNQIGSIIVNDMRTTPHTFVSAMTGTNESIQDNSQTSFVANPYANMLWILLSVGILIAVTFVVIFQWKKKQN